MLSTLHPLFTTLHTIFRFSRRKIEHKHPAFIEKQNISEAVKSVKSGEESGHTLHTHKQLYYRYLHTSGEE